MEEEHGGGTRIGGRQFNRIRGEGVGGRYEKINSLLVCLSSDLGIDLWTLDALWWFLLEPEGPPDRPGSGGLCS